MAETTKYALPLLAAAQAQKHVTVNEALARLDALAQPVIADRTRAEPPAGAAEGVVYAVPAGASGEWAGRDGALAIRANGGWSYAAPAVGQRAWLAAESTEAVFDGAAWVVGQGAVAHGAATLLGVATLDHALGAGAASTTAAVIPDKAVVIGVTARVLQTITGAGVTGWRLGAAGDHGRYGGGYGLQAGSFAHGVTGAPLAYYGGASLVIEAEGGAFAGGLVRLCVHHLSLTPPRWT